MKAPQVSICVPTWQGRRWIREALESALAQEHDSFEVVVSDDGSDDGTREIVAGFDDPRLRLSVNERRLGMPGNWNRSIHLARGRFIKPLQQDDLLEPDCIATLAAALEAAPEAAFAFSPRHVLLEDPSDPWAQEWMAWNADLQKDLGPVRAVEPGSLFFEAARREEFGPNWVGEPSVVMIRRAALERTGLFNERLAQIADLEMWLRLAFFGDMAFVPRPLATFRVHSASATRRLERAGRVPVERLWLVEGLLQHDEIAAAIGRSMRGWVAWTLVQRQVPALLRGEPPGRRRRLAGLARELRAWALFLLRRPRPRLHAELAPVGAGGAAGSGASPGSPDLSPDSD